jgi:hypothetical protein
MLHFNQMPESFTGQALYCALKSPYFNSNLPIENSLIINGTSQLLMRIGLAFCANAFCAPLGIIYHSSSAFIYRVRVHTAAYPLERERRMAFAFEHFKAAIADLPGIFNYFKWFRFIETSSDSGLVLKLFSDSDVYIPDFIETGNVTPFSYRAAEDDGIRAYRILGCQGFQCNILKFFACRDDGNIAPLNNKEVLKKIAILWNVVEYKTKRMRWSPTNKVRILVYNHLPFNSMSFLFP